MATIKGNSIIFGNPTLATTLAGMGTLNLLQDLDYSKTSDKVEVGDYDGDTAAVVYYNNKATATLNFVVTGGVAAATPTTLSAALSPGALVTLAGGFTSGEVTPLTDVWLVSEQGSNITTSNTGAVRARVNLEAYLDNSIP